MGKITAFRETSITCNTSTEGESIEVMIKRAIENGEKLGEEAPLIYTERKEGVLPGYNIAET